MPFTLPQSERLKGKRAVSALMTGGRWGFTTHLKYCCRIRTQAEEDPVPGRSRIMVSVPKRLFKRAVRRNLYKRRMREAYRTQKALLEGVGADILFLYNTREDLPFEEVRAQVETILKRIGNEAHR